MEPILSVCCITFNQEKYVEETLKGFFIQETTFPFEILIHDDASTDNTPKILEKYEKIDHRISVIYQSENKYSQGEKPFVNYLFPKARGKYIAMCEGDDYWTDPAKLQKQVDFLEKNNQFSACFTNAMIRDEIQNKTFPYQQYKKNIFSIEDIIKGSGSLFPTASLVFRNKIREFPSFFFKAKSGDRALALLLGNLGNFYLLNEITCVYRRHSTGIFSSIIKNIPERRKIDGSNIELLGNFNIFTKRKYEKQISKAISKRTLISLQREGNEIFRKENIGLLKNLVVADWLRLIKSRL